MKSNTKIFDGRALRLDNVAAGTDRRIKTVAVLNNTPFFLYVGREQNVTRESALFVVEPYTDVIQPVSEAQALYVVEGPAIGTVPPNAQATILYGPEVYAQGTRRTSRTVSLPLWRGEVTAQAQTVYLTAQSVSAAPPAPVLPGQAAGVFAIPAAARRRAIYGAGGVQNIELEGSVDGSDWFGLLLASQSMVVPEGMALPPFLRVRLSGEAGQSGAVYLVVDL